MSSNWLDADETASSLQITRATLSTLIREGRVPAREIQGRRRVSRARIEELFEATTLGSGREEGS